jgi:F-type H+-transporting ATPase subunit a
MRSFGRRPARRFLWLPAGVRLLLALAVAALTLGAPSAGSAQEHAAPAPTEEVDIITPHITDSYHLEIPWFNSHFAKEVCIGRHLPNGECGPLWGPIGHIGSFEVNLSPTKHVVFLLLAALISTLLLVGAARAHNRHTHTAGHPKGFAAGIEAMVPSSGTRSSCLTSAITATPTCRSGSRCSSSF